MHLHLFWRGDRRLLSILHLRSSIFVGFFSILLITVGVGCSGHRSEADYQTPDADVQNALSTALTAWKDGKQPDAITGVSPAIKVLDSKWQGGDKLSDFEILDEEEGPEGSARVFAVKLTSPTGEVQTVRYVLVGKGEIWVFRDEDYTRITGMEGGFTKKKRKR